MEQNKFAKQILVVVVVASAIFLLWNNNSRNFSQITEIRPSLIIPSPTNVCNPPVIKKSLDDLKYAYEDFNDSIMLSYDASKASNYSSSSPAVVTALSKVTEKRRSIERLPVVECISQVNYSLLFYAHSIERDTRDCLLKKICDVLLESDTDFQMYFKYGRCLENLPVPSRGSDNCFTPFTIYEPDGSIWYPPLTKAALEAWAQTEVAKVKQKTKTP